MTKQRIMDDKAFKIRDTEKQIEILESLLADFESNEHYSLHSLVEDCLEDLKKNLGE